MSTRKAGRICNAPSSRTAAFGIGPYRVRWIEGKAFRCGGAGEDVCVAGDLAGGTDAVPAEDAAV